MMARRVGALALAIALTGVSVAWAAAADPRLNGRLDPRTRDAVSALVDSARNDGIPTEPLIDRALEGASKRADGALIVAVVRGLAADLRKARQALGPASTDAEVTAGAAALRAGVRIQELERLRSTRSGQRYAVALDVMSYLVTRGVPADTASRVIVSLVLASATENQILGLRADIERDIAGGVPAGLSASARGIGLEQVIAASAPTNSGAPGAALPSGRGSIAPGGPLNSAVAGSVSSGAPADGSKPPAPRGKPKQRP